MSVLYDWRKIGEEIACHSEIVQERLMARFRREEVEERLKEHEVLLHNIYDGLQTNELSGQDIIRLIATHWKAEPVLKMPKGWEIEDTPYPLPF